MKIRILISSLCGMLYLTACATAPTPTATETPTAVPSQPTSEATITVCDPAQFIDVLRDVMPYEESVVSYNHYSGSADLTVWFVDPALDPQVSDSEIQDQSELAFRHSVEAAHLMAVTESCVAALFDSVTVIAVDPLYQAWYVGAVPAFEIPIDELSSEDDWAALEEKFDSGYQQTGRILDTEDQELPEGACTWSEARQAMEQAFSQAQDVALYYYIEPGDASIYVQWSIPSAAENAQQVLDSFFLPLPYIDSAVSCLYPEFDTLWLLYVRPDGEAQWVFAVDGDAVREDDHQAFLDNLEVIYETNVE